MNKYENTIQTDNMDFTKLRIALSQFNGTKVDNYTSFFIVMSESSYAEILVTYFSNGYIVKPILDSNIKISSDSNYIYVESDSPSVTINQQLKIEYSDGKYWYDEKGKKTEEDIEKLIKRDSAENIESIDSQKCELFMNEEFDKNKICYEWDFFNDYSIKKNTLELFTDMKKSNYCKISTKKDESNSNKAYEIKFKAEEKKESVYSFSIFGMNILLDVDNQSITLTYGETVNNVLTLDKNFYKNNHRITLIKKDSEYQLYLDDVTNENWKITLETPIAYEKEIEIVNEKKNENKFGKLYIDYIKFYTITN